MPDGVAPDAFALRLDVAGIVENREDTGNLATTAQRQVVSVYGRAAEVQELADALWCCSWHVRAGRAAECTE